MFYTVGKFIENHRTPQPGNDTAKKQPPKYPYVSRTLGKIAVPLTQIGVNELNQWWMVRVEQETGAGNRGVIHVTPIYRVDAAPLLPGMFDQEQQQDWCFLHIKSSLPRQAYYIPQAVKKAYLTPDTFSVVCVPYLDEDLKSIPMI